MAYGSEKTIEILKGVAKKTKSKAAKELTEEDEFEAARCAADQLFHEAMEMYCDGTMTWKEAVEDLYENLKAVPMPEPPEDGDGDEPEKY